MEILVDIIKYLFESPSGMYLGVAPALIAKGVGQVAGLVKAFSGGGKRRREQRAAEAEMGRYKEKYEQLDTSNPYANMTNPFENLTVNTQAADFAAQQNSQNSANIMSGLAAAAGGGGVAALAQSMANSQAQATQQASASIAQQESQNQQLAAQGEFKRQSMIAAGEQEAQSREASKTATLLSMSQQRVAAAKQAREKATQEQLGALSGASGDLNSEESGLAALGGLAAKGGQALGGLVKGLGAGTV
ncbi:MAG: hypothetical protein O3A79_03885 [Candidatus Marinimicrobia bacterium]|nr:hypothetical protein [Candidatus Neomarinimicrobiota bacterium]